ncbi:Uncharacterized protein APZ42_002625, partial [Daphnia magna]
GNRSGAGIAVIAAQRLSAAASLAQPASPRNDAGKGTVSGRTQGQRAAAQCDVTRTAQRAYGFVRIQRQGGATAHSHSTAIGNSAAASDLKRTGRNRGGAGVRVDAGQSECTTT